MIGRIVAKCGCEREMGWMGVRTEVRAVIEPLHCKPERSWDWRIAGPEIRSIIVPLHCKRQTMMVVRGFVGYQARYRLLMHKLNYEA